MLKVIPIPKNIYIPKHERRLPHRALDTARDKLTQNGLNETHIQRIQYTPADTKNPRSKTPRLIQIHIRKDVDLDYRKFKAVIEQIEKETNREVIVTIDRTGSKASPIDPELEPHNEVAELLR